MRIGAFVIERITAPTEAARALVGELEAELSAAYPPEQRHGLALEAIFQRHIRFFVATLDGVTACRRAVAGWRCWTGSRS